MTSRFEVKILIILCALLSACSFSYKSSVDEAEVNNDSKYSTYNPHYSSWLKENKYSVIKEIASYIREKHPNTTEWFPRLEIRKIRLEMPSEKWSTSHPAIKPLREILQGVSDQLLPVNENSEIWKVDIDIRFANQKVNPALFAAAHDPYGLLCWGTILLVCPVKSSGVFVIDGNIITTEDKRINLKGYGGSTIYLSTPWLADNPEAAGFPQAESKAIAAATADFANKLVKVVEKMRP